MNAWEIFLFFFLPLGGLAGFVGALTGLGGGVVLVPLLTLLFHVDLHYALGASRPFWGAGFWPNPPSPP